MPAKVTTNSAFCEVSSGAKRGGRKFLVQSIILFGGIVASLAILKFAPAPFFWLWLTWAMVCFQSMSCLRGEWPRAVLLNLGVVACLLAGVEAYFVTDEYTATVFSDGFIVPDDVLGWAPAKGIQAHAFKQGPAGLLHGPQGILFDTNYTIDPNGLRIAPRWDRENSAATILFFGCSFTFGEGVKDNETLPYQVGAQSGGRYRVFNFGFEAYGPEQMLAAIEHGMVSRIVDTTPKYAYYVAIPNHVWRVAGRTAWGRHAPRYVVGTNGTVHQEGYFENRRPLALRLGLGGRVEGQLDKSATWRVLSMNDSRITDKDIRLYFAVVQRSKDLLETQYPGIQFRVILWPNQHVFQQRATYEKLRDGFRQMNIPVDLVEDILPGYRTDRAPYILGSADHHPNSLADRILARQVLDEMQK
jgi:hypothetical protein